MSSYRAQSGLSSRPSYFELYPDRLPASNSSANPPHVPSSTPPRRQQPQQSVWHSQSSSTPSPSGLPPRTTSRSPATSRHGPVDEELWQPKQTSQHNSILLSRAFNPFSTSRHDTPVSPPRERRMSAMPVESSAPISPAQPTSDQSPSRRPSSALSNSEQSRASPGRERDRSEDPPQSQVPWPSQTRHAHDAARIPSTPPRNLSSRSASSGTIDIKTGLGSALTGQPPGQAPFPSIRRKDSTNSVHSHTSYYDFESAIDTLMISNAERGSPAVFKTPPRSNPRVQSIFPTKGSPRGSPSHSIQKNGASPPRTPIQDVFQAPRTPRTPANGRIDLAHLPSTPVTPVFAPSPHSPPNQTMSAARRDEADQFTAGSFPTAAVQYPSQNSQSDKLSRGGSATMSDELGDGQLNGAGCPFQSTETGLAPAAGAVDNPSPNRIKSIDEIVRAHAGPAYVAKMTPKPTPAQALAAQARARQAEAAAAAISAGNGHAEDLAPLPTATPPPISDQSPHKSPGSRSRNPFSFGRRLGRSPSKQALGASSDDERADVKSVRSFKSSFSGYVGSKSASPGSFSSEALSCERELALLLKSPRLTRIANMHRSPNQGLTVSYADVGAADGHPVIVYLGLGSVRYLVALFDEMAQALGLRLICLDRWGLGRTSTVSDDKRGFYEWSAIVQEFAQQLNLQKFSVLAHSAGAPYALATAAMSDDHVFGSLHLLAPWVSTSADSLAGAYKLLKFVPTGVIKTAQAAEWKMQSWRLGKPPTIQHAAVGYNAKTGQLISGSGSLVSSSSKSVYDASDSMSTMTGVVPRTPPQYGAARFVNGTESFSITPSPSSRRNSVASRMLSGAFLATPPSSTSILGSASPSVSGTDLANGLLRASHAESLRGSTADLMVILERTSKSSSGPAVRYENMSKRVKIWYGDKDERISINSIRTLEANLHGRCEVRVVDGADHNLMTNGQVMLEVLESLAREWRMHG
ncbi:hypothetical protein OIV83_000293 [Microbotryomycetes sp. JL201]|nr:hypothetical protein OIV83_000293 [Microbotryomycetes sp. JL201]